jgi:hypothetical protein
MFARCSLVALVALALPLAACRRAEIASYRVPKEKDAELPMAAGGNPPAGAAAAPATAGPSMANTPVATAQGSGLTWTAPAHWQAKPAGAMRKGSYTVPGADGATADLSITAFPGDVGGELANVNRWRGQISLPPIAAEELASAVTRVSAHGLELGLVDFAGPGAGAQRILGAMAPYAGSTWFFKLMGPDAVVAKEKAAFLEFLKTVRPAEAATP